jgi:hypothetical protein
MVNNVDLILRLIASYEYALPFSENPATGSSPGPVESISHS